MTAKAAAVESQPATEKTREEYEEVVNTLGRVGDPRAIDPLARLIEEAQFSSWKK